ncbi:Uu.00g034270.m01.CDS01 [Anthostomella pinea]|uniref:Uu.00g034270.m01.CDS01 n=1 Tax=Anthostomella pinea TaxID=933095 RepID=A0AAI8V8W1_9PEZI|nr:Uu.00g034270.m01.CDS01 [Anthostomella pinea]
MTWLGQTAKSCGWKPTTQPVESLSEHSQAHQQAQDEGKGPRLKGKARKAAKDAAKTARVPTKPAATSDAPIFKYTVTTQDLLKQIDKAAIKARRRCALWYERTQGSNQSARDGHQHFIDMLQRALNVLRSTDGEPEASVSPKNGPNPKATDVDFVRNAFEALEVEDISEDEDDAATQATPPSKSTQVKQTNYVYELESDKTWELAFAVFSFFEDLHRLRTEMKETYRMYTDLYHDPSEYTYGDLADIMYTAQSITTGEGRSFLSAATLELSPFDEFAFFPASRALIVLGRTREAFQKFAWPAPITPMRFNYISRPDLLMNNPRMQRYKEQHHFISQMVLDMHLHDTLKNPSKSAAGLIGNKLDDTKLPFEDPMYSSLRPVWTEGIVTTKAVFAAQLLWDIHTLRKANPNTDGTKALNRAAIGYQRMFKFITHLDGALDTEDVRWLSKDSWLLMDISRRVEIHLKRPPIIDFKRICLKGMVTSDGMPLEALPPEQRKAMEAHARAQGWTPATKEHEENAKRLGAHKTVKPHESPSFLVDENLLYGGTILLDIASMAEEAGVALANHHLSIFATAHLYNALFRLGLCQTRWPEIKRIMEKHVDAIFANDVPTNIKDMVSRFAYRTGVTTTNARRFNAKMPWKFQATPATQAETHSPQSPGHVSSSGGKKSIAAPGQRKHLTPRHALHSLEKYIGTVLPDIEIDYVNLTRRCNKLMNKLRSKISADPGINYPSIQTPGDTNDHGYLVVVLGTQDEMIDFEERRKRPKKGRQTGGDAEDEAYPPQIQLANDILLDFLKSSNP